MATSEKKRGDRGSSQSGSCSEASVELVLAARCNDCEAAT